MNRSPPNRRLGFSVPARMGWLGRISHIFRLQKSSVSLPSPFGMRSRTASCRNTIAAQRFGQARDASCRGRYFGVRYPGGEVRHFRASHPVHRPSGHIRRQTVGRDNAGSDNRVRTAKIVFNQNETALRPVKLCMQWKPPNATNHVDPCANVGLLKPIHTSGFARSGLTTPGQR